MTSSTLICLMAKASPTQAWLWHRRLSHLNFDYINLLSKKDVVIGLPKLKYVKDQLCSSCEVSKAKRSSFKTKVVPSSKGRLNLLHMDLCGPMRVASINGKKYILDQKFVAVKVPVGFVLKLDRKMACLSIHKLVRSTPDGCSCKLCEGQLVLHLVCGTRRHGVHLWSLSWILFKPRFDTTLAHLFCENETESKIFLAVKVWHHEFPVHDIGLTSIVDRRNVFSHDVAQNLTYGEIACIAHKSNGSPSLEQSRLELCKYIFQCLKARMAVIGKDDNGVFFSRWWDEEIFAMTSILALSTSIPFLEILWPADYFPSTIHLFSKMTGNLVVASKNAYSRWGGSSLSSPREVVLLSGIIVEWFICLWTIRIISLGPKERVSFFEKQEIISLNGVRVGEEVATIGSYTGVEFPLTIISVKPRTIESTSLTSLSMTSILFADMWSVIGPSIRSLIPNLGRCAVLCEQEGALGTFVTSGIGFTTIVPSLNSRGGSFSAIFGLAPSIGESEKAYKLIRSNWNIGDPHCGGDLVESNGYEHEGLLFVYDRMNLFVADKIDLPCSVRNCCLKFKDKDCVLVPIGWVLGAIDQFSIGNSVLQRNLQAAVISVQTDKGIEFLNKTLYAFFKEEGIEHQTSTPRTPEQNGVVERRNHTLVEAARTMLLAFKLPLFFWAEAIATACYTQNRSIIIPTHEKMAYDFINNRKPSIKHLHIFSCTCYLTKDDENLDKMKEKGDPCILALDYENLGPVPQLQHVSPSADTTTPSQQELDLLFGPLYDEFFTADHPLSQVRGNPSKPVQTRRKLATDPEICMFALTMSTAEPKSIKEAMADSALI
ncbi:retrovirus-related pol polyprotein from transposon TNT 1-94 [Tanacetum coccineum]